ncbi:PB1 domain containing protein [Acanthamoeba castellanii str. Neff]|uniref:PB1 domain containing protein n=1 Tax=Acanthamoeba castellanii (strain ATCC 30010 / Neff) TaxID=1257118 RepID=L8GMM9_ACACF|nr:PB1 domain containing protein [Acanthamoeba castellanii str. Neff]ELR14008.1 PB1 domain containing protein [Acanthamoeba castellanii str. Neff]
MVLIKAYLGNDARRVTVEDDIPFADLRAMLMKLFAVSGSGEPITPPAPTQFWIRYKDDEDDLVSISTDSDLREAIAYSASNADLLRLYIQQGDGDDGKVETDAGGSTKRPATSVGVHAIPHHTLQHRNNLVLQSLAQPEFAVQISKMVSQVVTTQNPAFTDLIQQMVQALAPQMESLLLPAVSAVLQQQTTTLVQQQQQQQQQQAALYARQQQSPLQAPNTYPIYSHPPPAQSPYSPPPTPTSLPIPYSPAPSSGLAEPLTPTAPTSTEKKKESTTPSGISAMRNMLPSIFKVGIPTTSPGPSPPTSDKDGRMSSSPPQSYAPPPQQQQDRRKRSSSSIHEADFSWVDSEGSGSGGNIAVGGGLGGSGNGRRDPSPRHRSVSNPVPIAASPPTTSSSTDLSQMSPSSFSPSPLVAMAAAAPASPASRARAAPPALPPPGVTFTEEQYQQLYREWEPVLAQLKQMGFEDPRRNIDLILAHRGSMVDVVEQLLNRKS